MMMTLFDDDQIMKAYTKDIREEAAKEAAKKAAKEAAKETALEMLKDGDIPLEKIAKYVPALTMEELRQLKEEVLQMV